MRQTKNKKNALLPWIMWGFAALFYCYQFIIRVCPSVMADDWMLAFGIDASSLGIMAAFYYYAYSGIQIPLGLVMDKLGPRIMLTCAGLICGLGCFLTAHASDLWMACLGRFCMGLGAASGFLGTMKVATMWFPPSKIGMLAGLTTALGTLGGIFGQAPLSLLNGFIGWQSSLYALTAAGIGIAVLIWICIRDSPEGKSIHHTDIHVPLLDGLKQVVTSSQAWLIALFGCMMYVPLAAFSDLWGVSFLKATYGFREEYAATMTSSIYVGVVVGGIFLGKFTSLFKGFKRPMFIGSLGSLLCYATVIYIHPLPEPMIYGLLFLGGVSFAPECLCFAAVCDQLPKKYGGIAIGFTNMVVMISGAIMQPVIGWLLRFGWDGEIDGSIPKYTLNDFHQALWVIPACLITGSLILALVRDKPSGRH